VRKEALLKAWGVGLSYPLRQISVTIFPGEPPKLKSSGMPFTDHSEWQLFDVSVDTGYTAALAFPGLNMNITFNHQSGSMA
ncbi:MAG: 4'-phosphopantetheinyl transferase superfamily protein, partial [bacterium]